MAWKRLKGKTSSGLDNHHTHILIALGECKGGFVHLLGVEFTIIRGIVNRHAEIGTLALARDHIAQMPAGIGGNNVEGIANSWEDTPAISQ